MRLWVGLWGCRVRVELRVRVINRQYLFYICHLYWPEQPEQPEQCLATPLIPLPTSKEQYYSFTSHPRSLQNLQGHRVTQGHRADGTRVTCGMQGRVEVVGLRAWRVRAELRVSVINSQIYFYRICVAVPPCRFCSDPHPNPMFDRWERGMMGRVEVVGR